MRSQWIENGAGDLRSDKLPLGMKSLFLSVLMVTLVLTLYLFAAMIDEHDDEQLCLLAIQEKAQLQARRHEADARSVHTAEQLARATP